MSPESDTPLSVLLVEDNPNDATLIEKHLREADSAVLPERIEITHVQSLDPGIELLAEGEIDLLLLDLGLKKSHGVETFDRVEEHITEIPVIVLTGLQDEQAAVDLLQQGAQDYLTKNTLDRERLVKSLRYALERKERERQLQDTTEQLEVLNRILRHDLQNDLQALTSWLEALEAQIDGEDEQTDILDRALSTVEHMEELTTNSKAYIQLITGSGDDVSLESVRLDQVLTDEVGKARSTHASAEFQTAFDLTPVTVRANEMLSSVFRNILNNGVRHCDKSTPEIEVSMEIRDQTVVVSIADNGPGVREAQKEEIFGKGSKGLESTGTGIGLYLVDTLVTRYGGSVWVEDNEPEGAIFNVELQLDQPA